MTTATQARRDEVKAERLKLLTHPTRIEVLRLLADGNAAPVDLAKEKDISIAAAAYHFQQLAGAKAIRLVKVEPARGTMRHVYGITAAGREILAMAERL